MKRRKSAREKIYQAKEARILPIPAAMERRWGRGLMLIPTPLELEALMREIPFGIVVSVGEIRQELARRHSVELTCPLVTELFWRMIAEAAVEDDRDGVEGITPYWRVVRDDGSLNARLPGGVRVQADRLLREEHVLLRTRGSQRLRVPFQSEGRPDLWLKASGFVHF